MPGSSSITEPVTSRLLRSDAAALRDAATREGTTVSELIKQLVSESRSRFATA